MKSTFPIQQDRAFSRIDLTVVVALVLVLAALLSAMLAGAKPRALRIQCANN